MGRSTNCGVIYMCYPGAGKSSTVKDCWGFIDLESSNFKLEDGSKPKDWYKYYVQTAFDLVSQGYSVFLSTHKDVREYVAELRAKRNQDTVVAVVYPSLKLKDEWITRLQSRYDKDPTTKNELALERAKVAYSEDIEDMKRDADEFIFWKIELSSTDYKLIDEILLPDEWAQRPLYK